MGGRAGAAAAFLTQFNASDVKDESKSPHVQAITALAREYRATITLAEQPPIGRPGEVLELIVPAGRNTRALSAELARVGEVAAVAPKLQL